MKKIFKFKKDCYIVAKNKKYAEGLYNNLFTYSEKWFKDEFYILILK
jgi:hypothetical protein